VIKRGGLRDLAQAGCPPRRKEVAANPDHSTDDFFGKHAPAIQREIGCTRTEALTRARLAFPNAFRRMNEA
jgi:hypothetical protein